MVNLPDGFPPQGQKVVTIQDVVQTAEHVKWLISTMWWNSDELDTIDTIVQKARTQSLTAAEAILELQAIPDNKHWNWWHGLQW